MFAILFLVLAFLVGVGLLSLVWKGNKTVLFAGGFLVGVLIFNWLVYLVSFGTSFFVKDPLLWGNVFVFISMVGFLFFVRKKLWNGLKIVRSNLWSIGVGLVVALVFCFLFYYTFRVEERDLLVGVTVFSDFGPHLALIRSFSLGFNFPTVYPHFPAGDVRYHFMFDFAVGNLEYLGLRVDHAFNGLSVLSVMSFALLLFELARKITGSVAVGVLTLVLWFFRSSLAFWNYLASDGWWGLLGLSKFIGETNHEDWGLWNQNVYLNQRHLMFAWGVLILILILFLPNVIYEKKRWWMRWWEGILGKKEKIDWRKVLFCGSMLGLLGFWNGAVVIAGLLVLGTLMVFSKNKREFVGVLGLTVFLVYLQKLFFIDGAGVNFKYLFGFLAEERTVWGLVLYYVELLGVWIVVLVASLILFKKYWKWAVAFLTPFIFANVLILTPAIGVNHKYVMISVALLNVFVAWFLWKVFERRSLGKMIAGGLLFLLVVTGMVDVISIINMNREPMKYSQGEFFDWVITETEQGSVFLTPDMPVNNEIFLGGRYVYYGWPYYAWGAGYDTRDREKKKELIYENSDWKLARSEGIDYVIYGEKKDLMVHDLDVAYEDDRIFVFRL